MNAENTKPITFRPKPLFQAVYAAPLLLVAALVYDLARAPARETWVMLGATLLIAALSLPRARARVDLAEDRLTLHMPLHKPRTIHLRQLIAVEALGRGWNTLLLRYHPMDERGRLDIANEEFLGLAPLDNQSLLEDRLRAITGD